MFFLKRFGGWGGVIMGLDIGYNYDKTSIGVKSQGLLRAPYVESSAESCPAAASLLTSFMLQW